MSRHDLEWGGRTGGRLSATEEALLVLAAAVALVRERLPRSRSAVDLVVAEQPPDSLFARRCLAALTAPHEVGGDGGGDGPAGWDVMVGGLGLGYTARTVLEDDRVASLTVVETLAEVIAWHVDGLLPGGTELAGDPRTRLLRGDFFALARDAAGLDPDAPGRLFDAVLVDIDHTPEHLLHPSHGDLYSPAGLLRVARSIRPGGVFGLWSDDPPHPRVEALLEDVFHDRSSHVVDFANHLTGGRSACTVYLGRVAG